MKKEAITHGVWEDLANRNENWTKLDGVIDQVDVLETDATALELRVGENETSISSLEANKQETKVKISSVEKELNSLKSININSNQEATQVAQGHGVVNLPKTAGEGHANFGIKGLTATNLIENGDFSNGTAGWVDLGLNTVDNGILYINSNTVNNVAALTSISSGHKYYLSVTLKSKTGTEGGMTLVLKELGSIGFEGRVSNFIVINQNSSVGVHSEILTATGDGGKLARERSTRGDMVFGLDNFQLINLTKTFGAGNEPTKEECDVILSNYFDGTKSTVSASRLKSVGKNLFKTDGDMVYKNLGVTIEVNNELIKVSGTPTGNPYVNVMTIPKGRLKAGVYKLSKNNVSGSHFNLMSRVMNRTSTPSISLTNSLGDFIIEENHPELLVEVALEAGLVYNDTFYFQIERNTVATPYEPYTESTQYLPNVGELRSLPNGVADEIVNGELVKRTKEIVLYGVEDWKSVGGSTVNTIMFYTGKFSDWGSIRDNINTFTSNYPQGLIYNLDEGGCFVSETNFFVRIDKTKLTTLNSAGFKAWLQANPVTLTYQLAEPIVTPINVSGNLISYPSGTVYIEQVVADAGLYTTKMDILNTELPIKILDKLSKVDYTTGLEHSLDVSKAVVTAQSFTHPDLVENDIVFFEYYYDLESTNGNASVEYYDSRYTVKDSVTDKVYKWSITIANGVPTITTVEV